MDLIQSKYHPRPYQLPVLNALLKGIKRVVLCWHRRSGKDITILNWCIPELIRSQQICYYILPTYAQAKKVIWDALDSSGMRVLDYFPEEYIAQKNSQEMKIRLKNGSLFQLVGSDNIDTIMGTNPKLVVFSEYALQGKDAWPFISPILRANKGTAIFISTPRGKNHFYDMYRNALSAEGWFAQKLTIDDTGIISKQEFEEEKNSTMSEELALQEYYCSFDRGVEGSYYSKLINKMQDEERIASFKHDPYKMVHTAWDLGWDDSTAIIFFQVIGSSIYIIDSEEHSNRTFAFYKEIISKKPYKYGYHLFPHDVENNDGLGSGCTRKEILEDLQIPVTTVSKNLIPDGIESVKALMSSRLYIDKNQEKLLKSLEHYHRDWDDKHKVYSNKPRHDWASHYADALRYLAVGLPKINSTASIEDDYKALRNYWG